MYFNQSRTMEKLVVILTATPLKVICLSSLDAFKILSFFFFFSGFTVMYLGVDSFLFILLKIHWASVHLVYSGKFTPVSLQRSPLSHSLLSF